MTIQQKNSVLVMAIIAGLLSLPMTWFTLHNAQISMPGGNMLELPMLNMTLNATGLNGSVTLLFATPLWFVILVSIGASALQLMRHSQAFEIPRIAEWIAAVIAVIWTTLPVFLALGSGRVSLGLGWILGLGSAVAPLACLILAPEQLRSGESAPLPDQIGFTPNP